MDMSDMDMGDMDMGGMDMGGMDMDSMNMYFVSTYKNYPVMFKNLKAANGGAAFGIFCVLFFGAFALRGLSFLSLYLEQKVWLTQSVNITIDECDCDGDAEDDGEALDNKSVSNAEEAGACCGGGHILPDAKQSSAGAGPTDIEARRSIVITNPRKIKNNNHNHNHTHAHGHKNKNRLVLAQLFAPGLHELFKDLVRLVLYFVTAIFSFALMIAAMSYVLLYFFAICLGIAFGELFFNRLRIATGLNDNINGVCGNLH